ncbi:general transcription factor II-I repeat domain-containing protein 2A-like [Neoarius graeffei]|uniref:general transcription factor II-I repeat domain-containing protein 2A-like n=1 Tax=Neoarius graeffei TaxID=443677 RepID=UPI00298CCE58|nr:general transcription factor II-I repeat domain-containing protein 2A-like [Neoarius graeffei]
MLSKKRKIDAESLQKQQAAFSRCRDTHEGAVKASYAITWEIAKASKPFSEGEFVRNCMIKAAELACPEKRQALANISLSRPTVTERVEELSSDLNSQLKEKIKSFIAFSIALDESTDVTDTAQLAIFIRGVDASLHVTEEFVSIVPLTDTTTANDVFVSLVGALDNLEVDWSRAVSVATDGAPSMVGRKAGVVVKLREKVREANPDQVFWNFHCILHQEALCCKSLKMEHVMSVIATVNFIRARGLNHRQFDAFLSENDIHQGLPYHTDVRWLSRGAVLKRFYKLRKEIAEFMQAKGKPVEELDDTEWTRDLAFLVDITEHLNLLNVNMQGRNKLVTGYYDGVRAFQRKLALWKAQLCQRNAAHFPCLKSLSVSHQSMDKYANLLSGLMHEFAKRFTVFTELEKDFAFFGSPFTTDASEVPEAMQMELIDLQCCTRLKDMYKSVGIESFYQSLPPEYPTITAFAGKILCMFGTTYLCEQAFSVMNINKSKMRNRMTHGHLNDVMKIATAQSLSPNVDKLVKNKRLLASTCKM